MTASNSISSVVVLGTGRCGTMTFIRACEHIENFTAGHESRSDLVGPERLAYPERHIEADNRLAWMLGSLARALPDERTLYVHLTRNPEDVVESFERRWDSTYRASMIRAFGHGITTRTKDWEGGDRRRVCAAYVQTVTDNITEFVSGRRTMHIELENLPEQFAELLDAIGAHGDRAAMMVELAIAHNASPPPKDGVT